MKAIGSGLGYLAILLLTAACNRTSFTTDKQTTFPAYNGKVVLLSVSIDKPEALGGVEVGTIRVDANPTLSNAGYVRRWKEEAARHGANAIRWYGEGGSGSGLKVERFALAKAYRFENINDPRLPNALAKPYEYYHD